MQASPAFDKYHGVSRVTKELKYVQRLISTNKLPQLSNLVCPKVLCVPRPFIPIQSMQKSLESLESLEWARRRWAPLSGRRQRVAVRGCLLR